MITTQREELRLVAVSDGGVCVYCGSLTVSQVVVGFSHLYQSESIVEGCDGDIATVDDLCPFIVGIDAGSWVEASKASLARTGSSDSTRPEACTRTVGHCSVKGCSKNGNVVFLLRVLQAACVREVGKGRDAAEAPLSPVSCRRY